MANERVCLLVDLTRHHPDFRLGAVGTNVGRSPLSDRFFRMCLESGAILDVLWKSVEVLPQGS